MILPARAQNIPASRRTCICIIISYKKMKSLSFEYSAGITLTQAYIGAHSLNFIYKQV
jgi:hypothetical protein